MMGFGYGYNPFAAFEAVGVVLGICLFLGLILGIVLLVVFLPARKRGKYSGAASWFYDFLNFNKYWITWLLKLFNIILAVVCLLGGFISLFIQPLLGLGLMIAYVIIRVMLEFSMVTLNIRDNVSSIDEKLSRMGNPGAVPQTGFTAPTPPAASAAPAPNVCPKCGSPVKPGSHFCMACGSPV